MKDNNIGFGDENEEGKVDITLDIDILEFLELPELKWETRERNGLTTRIHNAMLHVYGPTGWNIRTLGDLKNYVEENGWLAGPSYSNFRNMGEKSVEYLNGILRRYGIEPFEPMYSPKFSRRDSIGLP